jgi:hypothetical protein
VGIDPGLVHTGVVSLMFVPDQCLVEIDHEVVLGPDATAATMWAMGRRQRKLQWYFVPPKVFIEGYRPRGNFGTNTEMVKAVQEFRAATKGQVLDNTGVKKVVRRGLLELLGCWKFPTPTNHDDLRSAALIAVLGMLKDEQMNRLLADIVRDHLDGATWTVRT